MTIKGRAFAFVVLLLWAISPVEAQSPPSEQPQSKSVVHGTVLNMFTGEPITDAKVTLSASRSVQTDLKGQFAFEDVPSGQGYVEVAKPGFLCTLRFGEREPRCEQQFNVYTTDVTITLTMAAQATVQGRIVDQGGKPVDRINLCLMHRDVVDGEYVWGYSRLCAVTDSTGHFQFTKLGPAEYMLRTSGTADDKLGRPASDEGFPATYLPGVQKRQDAKLIVLKGGEALTIDLTLQHQKFQPVTISFAWDHAGDTGSMGWDLSNKEGVDNLRSSIDSHPLTFHAFVPPGEYEAQFTFYPPAKPPTGNPLPWPDGSKQPFLAWVNFSVKDEPVTFSDVPSQQPVSIPLHVSMLAPTRALPTSGVEFRIVGPNIRFDKAARWSANSGAADFRFEDMLPGRYKIKFGASDGIYVSSLTCGTIDLLREPLIVLAGTPPCSIKAEVRDDAALVRIGLPPQLQHDIDTGKTHYLEAAFIPLDQKLEGLLVAFLSSGDRNSVLIPPGKYLTLLTDGRQLAWRDPAVLRQLMPLGVVLDLTPSKTQDVTVDLHSELYASDSSGLKASFGQLLTVR